MNASFALLPPDVLRHEIAPRLDCTSLAQWRATERCVGVVLPVPPPSVKHWELAASHVNKDSRRILFEPSEISLAQCLDQAIHDDHVARINQLWPTFLRMASPHKKGVRRYWRHIIYVCAACGSYCAWVYITWSFMTYWNSPCYWTKHLRKSSSGETIPPVTTKPLLSVITRLVSTLHISLPDFAAYVLGRGQLTFLVDVCGLSKSDVFLWAIADSNTEPRREVCVITLMRHGHGDLVDALWNERRLVSRAQFAYFQRDVKFGALHYGLVNFVTLFAGVYAYMDFYMALFRATSAEGFKILALRRPDIILHFLAIRERYCVLNTLKNQGARSAAVYEWVRTLH